MLMDRGFEEEIGYMLIPVGSGREHSAFGANVKKYGC